MVFLCRLTDPLIEPIRSRLGTVGPVDFSPMVAIVILVVLQSVVNRLLLMVLFRT